jgi:hypothetical protein
VVNVDTQKSPASATLTADTWYHLYLYMSGGTPAVELVTQSSTTVPTPYKGDAKQKHTDNTRRYLWSIRTNNSASPSPQMWGAHFDPLTNWTTIGENLSVSPFMFMSGFGADTSYAWQLGPSGYTLSTTGSAGLRSAPLSLVPPWCAMARLHMLTTGTSYIYLGYFANQDVAEKGWVVQGGSYVPYDIPLSYTDLSIYTNTAGANYAYISAYKISR